MAGLGESKVMYDIDESNAEESFESNPCEISNAAPELLEDFRFAIGGGQSVAGLPNLELGLDANLGLNPDTPQEQLFTLDMAKADAPLDMQMEQSRSVLDFVPAEQIGTLREALIRSLTAAELRSLSADKVRALTPTQLGWLSNEQIQGLPLENCTGDQLRALKPEQLHWLTANQVASLAPAQVSALTNAQLRAFSGQQLSAIEPASLRALSSAQLYEAMLSIEMDSQQLWPSENRRAAFSTAQLRNLNQEQLLAVSGNLMVSRMSIADLQSLSTQVLCLLRPNDLARLLPGQVAAFSREQLGALSYDQVAALTGDQIRALTDNQLGLLRETPEHRDLITARLNEPKFKEGAGVMNSRFGQSLLEDASPGRTAVPK